MPLSGAVSQQKGIEGKPVVKKNSVEFGKATRIVGIEVRELVTIDGVLISFAHGIRHVQPEQGLLASPFLELGKRKRYGD